MANKKYLPAGRQAVVLLSGGLDSAVTFYSAKGEGFNCFCLIFDYGQRHKKEIKSAQAIAQAAGSPAKIIKISLPWQGSSLLDKKLSIPESTRAPEHQSTRLIPSTYVPGRNLIFLSFALSYAEAVGADAVYIGAHAQDYSGYPDCRPEFYRAFSRVVSLGTKAGVEGKRIEVRTPLVHKTKAQIIKLGEQLGVPFGLTWSCYRGAKLPCGRCDSCFFRAKGFKEVGIKDPLLA